MKIMAIPDQQTLEGPTVGFLAGVAAMPAGRGKGYARAVHVRGELAKGRNRLAVVVGRTG